MKNKAIRWLQRLSNYSKALAQLTKIVERGDLNDIVEKGLIQSFEYTYELAWNFMKDFLEEEGETEILGSRKRALESYKEEIAYER
jgi:nucleotidyltransferase substrate binding protein (TIGR01987 family)